MTMSQVQVLVRLATPLIGADKAEMPSLITSTATANGNAWTYDPKGIMTERQRRGEVRWANGAGMPTGFTFTLRQAQGTRAEPAN